MKLEKTGNPEIFWIDDEKVRWPATINLVPGYRVYGEKTANFDGKEYRVWNPNRSKIGAALMKGVKLPIKKGDRVLYLGASTGTTASHVSDIVGKEGIVYCADISERTTRDLVMVCERKNNMVPILADASHPEEYEYVLNGEVDFVFQDIAMPTQENIFILNCLRFLKKGNYGMIAIKARSIDVTGNPSEIFKESEIMLKEHFEIVDKKRLEPFEQDHIIFLIKRK